MRSKLLKDAETNSKYWELFKEDEIIPYFQGCFEGEAATKQSEKPLYQEYLGLNGYFFKFFCNIWVEIMKK